jgi:pimeloyl-ACP methyl ester carboxylesterase
MADALLRATRLPPVSFNHYAKSLRKLFSSDSDSRPGKAGPYRASATVAAAPSAPPEEAELFAIEQGEGQPLLLLHGFGANTYTWAKIRVMLSLRHRVFALDLKGFGQSPKPDLPGYSLSDHAECVLRFIARRELGEVAIVGHSFGGGVALRVALALQERGIARLRRLVLIDGMAWPQPVPWVFRAARTPGLGELLVSAVPPVWLVRLILLMCYYDPRLIGDATVEAYAAPLRDRAARRALLRTVRETSLADLEALVARLGELAVPVTLLWGKQDRVVPLAFARHLQAAIPSARLIVLDYCGHIPQEEFPAGTLAVLEEVL